ncbi:MAG: alpha/beta hydrolase [Propionibacteriaceae bacterium]|jgi:pimeloyl-ACP methyl ester carboxylesterase|nr:alpha/beta hydrolase [Propionibacteriaceae bacterium]
MASADPGGPDLFVNDLNPAAGAAVVMVHGLLTNHTVFYWCGALELADRYRVVLFDLPGHGRSEPDPADGAFRLDRLAGRVTGLLDRLGVERAALVGYSFGAAVALATALAAPDRITRLVLVEPFLVGPVTGPAAIAGLRAWADAAPGPRGPAGPWPRVDLGLAQGERLPTGLARARSLAADGLLTAALEADTGRLSAAALAAVTAPTAVLSGWFSPVRQDARDVTRSLAGATRASTWGDHNLPVRRTRWTRRHVARALAAPLPLPTRLDP